MHVIYIATARYYENIFELFLTLVLSIIVECENIICNFLYSSRVKKNFPIAEYRGSNENDIRQRLYIII